MRPLQGLPHSILSAFPRLTSGATVWRPQSGLLGGPGNSFLAGRGDISYHLTSCRQSQRFSCCCCNIRQAAGFHVVSHRARIQRRVWANNRDPTRMGPGLDFATAHESLMLVRRVSVKGAAPAHFQVFDRLTYSSAVTRFEFDRIVFNFASVPIVRGGSGRGDSESRKPLPWRGK